MSPVTDCHLGAYLRSDCGTRIHGDNVLWTDFGIAHEIAGADPTCSPTAHADTYSAPEVAAAKQSWQAVARTLRTLATDIFSLGCIFAELLTVICGKTLADFENRRRQGTGNKCYRDTNGKAASG
ncbi:hypothetical protein QBC33DRAFT_562499 [Phialemonium atrogriseum]|uniref:Protein kinase domain-containing protein n=1 Tax=Phialemonium atrogriseum TaxID=1093897 RepID=A0AAJ0FIS6_9PEZI|nr:uncharacterized protein QBC33DRAFT_562499 [Phialemonium atrogriseum]KAK1763634.1 hypothetical protein QBC33DRAFT_562499 [Phialemonium atrogriseum]